MKIFLLLKWNQLSRWKVLWRIVILMFSLPASSLAKANESVDVASIPGEKENVEEGNEKTNLEGK